MIFLIPCMRYLAVVTPSGVTDISCTGKEAIERYQFHHPRSVRRVRVRRFAARPQKRRRRTRNNLTCTAHAGCNFVSFRDFPYQKLILDAQ